ncbi:cytochrome c-type biogenesis protein CcmF [Alcanivorax hongdengensis A-11-3]|uniref:Cytochrome c-type biogenesis protein CcmF n=1 Tax=Alcanivorax hongdengensis A-11-3 TaxID=1177179 RepID=L0WCU9_9GAMM|nr:heme lyase CcmF/NrfE family subunit [Alcanivorax hongdengensis]EKF73922.1 cytochrome c-type biogenesis protein CcmF [Alcanivorax hongdengensis A-11-3]
MAAEIGQLSLWLALALASCLAIFPLVGVHRGIAAWQWYARPLAWTQWLAMSTAMVALGYCFYSNDFSVAYVANHSNSALPLHYRLAAIWGGHEGSLLLWGWMLSGWAALVGLLSRSVPDAMVVRVLSVMGMIAVGFLCFMLFTSNPFDRALPWFPLDGVDLNPLLQDPGLVVHPPMLYMGYVGFSVAFAFAVAGLMAGDMDPAWARWARPWTTVAWCFLTVGIALGSWWAYYELGWGGWWFWDPVENASLMPWLAGTALIHSLAVTEKRNMFRAWTVFLAIVAFSLSLLGTFLVRSGVLTSIHAFANDPKRGLFILVFLCVVAGGALVLFALRGGALRSSRGFKPLSREAFLLGNNLVLLTAASVVLMGTLFPLIGEAIGMKVSIRSPYFNAFFVPLSVALVLLLVPGVFSNWKRQPGKPLLRRLLIVAPAAVVTGALASRLPGATPWVGTLAIMLACYLVLAHLDDVLRRALAYDLGLWAGLGKLARSYWGMVLAHCGLAVLITGITLVSFYQVERDVRMAPGDEVTIGAYRFHFDKLDQYTGPNFDATRGHFTAYHHDRAVAVMQPEKRRYHAGGQTMTEAAIDPALMRDLYVALGEPLDKHADDAWAVRVYVKPGVRWIWLGALIMAFGGALALSDRRYRNSKRSPASER